MNVLDLADARIYLTRHRRPDWSVRVTAYGAMAVCVRGDEAIAFISRDKFQGVDSPKYVVQTGKGAVGIRDTLQSALDLVLTENRRMP